MRAYKVDPTHCPHCGCTDIEITEDEQDRWRLLRTKRCNYCERRWIDHYELKEVAELPR